jgi:ABC-2 type transport system permease protein
MIDPRKAFEIGRVNLVMQVRDRTDLFFVFVLPTIIIIALGIQFGGSSSARLGVVAPANDAAATALVAALQQGEDHIDVRVVPDAATLRGRVEHGQLEAGLVIPDGYGAALASSTSTVALEFIGTGGSLTTGLQATVQAVVSKVAAVQTAARVAASAAGVALPSAQTAANDVYAAVPGMRLDTTVVGERGQFAGFSEFTFGASSQLILFMFLTSMTNAGRLVYTRQIGVSRRMLSTPSSVGTIVAGEALGRYLVAILQAAYIVAITALVFNVSWGDPLATGALIALFGLCAAGVAMLVGAIARNPSQASSLGVFAGIGLGALGGCMIPYAYMPAAMQQVARLLPHSWALLGIQALIRDGGGISTVTTDLAVLAGWGVVAMTLAAWQLRRALTA